MVPNMDAKYLFQTGEDWEYVSQKVWRLATLAPPSFKTFLAGICFEALYGIGGQCTWNSAARVCLNSLAPQLHLLTFRDFLATIFFAHTFSKSIKHEVTVDLQSANSKVPKWGFSISLKVAQACTVALLKLCTSGATLAAWNGSLGTSLKTHWFRSHSAIMAKLCCWRASKLCKCDIISMLCSTERGCKIS